MILARTAYAASLLAIALVTLLAGCAPEPPSPRLSDINVPAAWLTPAEPLPDIPRCDQRETRVRVACRAGYDESTRGAYVRLAERHAALAGLTRVIVAKRGGS